MRGAILDVRFATGLPDLLALIKHFPHFLTLIKQMRLKVHRVSADPERNIQSGTFHSFQFVGHIVDITDGQVPIMVHVINVMVNELRAGFV